MELPKSVASVSIIEYGAMSRDVYLDDNEAIDPTILTCGWERLSTFHKSDSDGFRARLYFHPKNSLHVLAYRGSEFTKQNNLEADFLLANKKSSVFLNYAQDIYNTVCDQYSKPIVVTGHSLGGYLAQYISIFFWLKNPRTHFPYAIAFNSPHIGDLFPEQPYNFVLNIQIGGDQVHMVGKRAGQEYFLPAAAKHPLNSLGPMDIVRAIVPFAGKEVLAAKLAGYALYLGGEHAMDTVMQKLFELAEHKKEILGLPVIPVVQI